MHKQTRCPYHARYMMEKLRSQCEAALMSGVLVTRDNMFQVATLAAALHQTRLACLLSSPGSAWTTPASPGRRRSSSPSALAS